MRIAVCPGSFDPVTMGHMDIISRASGLFDVVIAAVLNNPEKQTSFTLEERLEFLTLATRHLPNVRVDQFGGLLVDYVREQNACVLIRGLRAISDFEYEFQMALMNKKLNPEVETVFLMSRSEYMYLSSSIVKQVASFGTPIEEFVPEMLAETITRRLRKEDRK